MIECLDIEKDGYNSDCTCRSMNACISIKNLLLSTFFYAGNTSEACSNKYNMPIMSIPVT